MLCIIINYILGESLSPRIFFLKQQPEYQAFLTRGVGEGSTRQYLPTPTILLRKGLILRLLKSDMTQDTSYGDARSLI